MAGFFAYRMAERDLCTHKLCLAGKVMEVSEMCQGYVAGFHVDVREMLAPLIYELGCLQSLAERFVQEQAEKEIVSEAESRIPEFRWGEMSVEDLDYCPPDAKDKAAKVIMLLKTQIENTPLKCAAWASIDMTADLLWRLESLIGWGEAGVYAVAFQSLLVESG